MDHKKKIGIVVLILAVLAVAGYAIAKKNSREMVNGYYVYEFDGETTEEKAPPEDAVEDVPEGIELQENETYIGVEESTETKSQRKDLMESFSKAEKASAADIEKEEKKLGLKGKVTYYYYSKLNRKQKAAYRSLLKGLRHRQDQFNVNVTRKDLNNLFCRVMFDHPELFWVETSYRYWDCGDYVILEPDYNRTKDQIKKDKQKLNKEIRKVLKEAKKEKKNYERILYIYKYLIRTIEYKKGVKDNQNIYSALVNKITVCAGYARATQLLLQKLGIQSVYVRGDTKRGRHAWNILKIGKKYYQMDTCWGDPNYFNRTDEYLRKLPQILRYDYEYFCIDDKAMFKTRTQNNTLGLPACNDTSKSFYIYNKRYFTKYDDKVKNSIKNSIRKGKNFWQGQMANKEAYNAFLNAVKNGLYPNYLYDIRGKSIYAYYQYFNDSYVIKVYY